MSESTIVYLGLGANLGDPIQQLIDARVRLANLPSCEFVDGSAYYLTSPVGHREQPDFINSVIVMSTTLDAHALLRETQSIENSLGRVRVLGQQNAARSIDIDILLFGDKTNAEKDLLLPHPRIKERLFVLHPLAELLHNQSHPLLGSIPELMANNQFEGQSIFRLVI